MLDEQAGLKLKSKEFECDKEIPYWDCYEPLELITKSDYFWRKSGL